MAHMPKNGGLQRARHLTSYKQLFFYRTCSQTVYNVLLQPGVFPGHDALGHQGVAYGMCAELFADPEHGCGVGVMTSGARLKKAPPLMRAGFDLLALGFAAMDL